MHLRFREAKTTQAAARLLTLRGGRMNYMKLIKLLYIVEREELLSWGRPVTADRCVSLPKGPILSQTLNLINEGPTPGTPSTWAEHISQPENYEVRLLSPAGEDELSAAEGAKGSRGAKGSCFTPCFPFDDLAQSNCIAATTPDQSDMLAHIHARTHVQSLREPAVGHIGRGLEMRCHRHLPRRRLARRYTGMLDLSAAPGSIPTSTRRICISTWIVCAGPRCARRNWPRDSSGR